MRRLAALPGVPPLLACVALLGVWEAISRSLGIAGLPPPGEALRALPALLGEREALLDIADSLRRMLLGFVLGLAFAVPLGLLMGRSRLAAASFGPLLGILYPIPK